MNVFPRSFCSLLLLVMFSFPLSLNAELWDSGPTAPFAPTQLFSGGDGQILLARASFSSVWLSRDGGYYWQCLDMDIYEVNNTSYYSVRPYMVNDSTYVFFCDSHTPDTHIIATFDYGESFVDRSPDSWPSNVNQNSFTVHLEFDDYWMIQTEHNVYFTEDAGESWDVTSAIPDDNYSTYMNGMFRDPNDVGIYYLCSSYYNYESDPDERFTRIYRTSQDPDSWAFDTPFIDTSDDLESMSIILSQILILSNGEILTTAWSYPYDPSWEVDHLVTFNENGNYATRSGGNLKFEELYLEDSYISGRIYAKVENCEDIYVSDDYGMTWSVLVTNGLPEIEPFHLLSFSQAKALHTLYISIKDVGIYKSDDHGANWELVETFDWSRFYGVYPNTDELYYSNFDSKWYRQSEPGSEITTLEMTHPDSIYRHNKIYYVHGDTILGSITSYPITDLFDGHLYRTFDNGLNWEFVADPRQQSVSPFYDPITEEFYLFSVSREGYSISRDYGDSWTPIPDPREEIEGVNVALSCFNRDRFYAYAQPDTFNYQVYELILGNNEWVNTNYPDSSGSTPHLLAVLRGAYSFGWDRNVYRYSGGRWEELGQIPETVDVPRYSKFLYNDPFAIIAYNRNGSEIIFTRDDGYSWRVLDLCLPGGASIGHINRFEQDFHRHRIWVVTNLGVFWYSMEDFLDAEEGKLELNPADFNLFTAYPNPFNASTRIHYHLSQPGNVKLDVFNIYGQLVRTLKNGYQDSGTQSVFFDGSGLASGTYLLRLETGIEIKNRRITLIK